MDIKEARDIVGNRAEWELRNIVKALGALNGALNSEEDNRRLEACKIVLKANGKNLRAFMNKNSFIG
jgi:hypothetical protein